jgi:hypothetical protein
MGWKMPSRMGFLTLLENLEFPLTKRPAQAKGRPVWDARQIWVIDIIWTAIKPTQAKGLVWGT